MPFEQQGWRDTDTGSVMAAGVGTLTFPQFDPSLGTLVGVDFTATGSIGATIRVDDPLDQLSSSRVQIDVTTSYSPGTGAPGFQPFSFASNESELVFLLFATQATAVIDPDDPFNSPDRSAALAQDAEDPNFVGSGTYDIEMSYVPTITGDGDLTVLNSDFEYGLEVVYTYLPPGEGGGEDSTLIPARVGAALDAGGGNRRLFVSDVIPTIAPVDPGPDPLDWTFELPEFKPLYGTLQSASIQFYGNITSTALLFDLFGSGNVVFGSASAQTFANFNSTAGGPSFPETSLAVNASGFTSFFGSTSLPVNGVGDTVAVPLGNLQGAIGEGRFDVTSAYTGAFLGSPGIPAFPQQAFIYGAEVEYIFTPGAGGDPIVLGRSNNTLTGSSGSDLIDGREGNDRLFGAGGADTLIGGEGRDFLGGGAGADLMAGGLGNDQYVVDNAGDRISGEIGFSLGGGIDTVRSYINYTLGSNVEILRLEGNANLNGNGGFAPENLVGNIGNNRLHGGGGKDQINGKAGNDVLIGGLGADTMVGDTGADVFRFNSVNDSRAGRDTRDFINGFQNGQDRINLSVLDADWTQAGNEAFNFIGRAAFTGNAGEVRYFTWGGNNFNVVETDHNGDGRADMQIFVNLTNTMTAGDFYL